MLWERSTRPSPRQYWWQTIGGIAAPGPRAQRRRGIALGPSVGALAGLPVLRAGGVPDWTRTLGLSELLASCGVALMASRGARYHHDGAHYGAAAFCNLFLSKDRGLDLHFRLQAIASPWAGDGGGIRYGPAARRHQVRQRGFDVDDFPPGRDRTQVFLNWELPIEKPQVGHALWIAFDIDPLSTLLFEDEQLWRNGMRAGVCPDSGRWRRAG